MSEEAMMMRHALCGLLLVLTFNAVAQQKGLGMLDSTKRPVRLPSGTTMKKAQVSTAAQGEFHPAGSASVSALLYDASDFLGFYLPTTDEVCEDVPLLGAACIRKIALAYYAPDIDGDETSSPVVNLTITIRSWDGLECSTPGELLQTFSISGLYDDGAWLLIIDLTTPITVPGSFYFGTRWSDDRVGWIIVRGRLGNALHDRSLNSFWNQTFQGCYWFGGEPPANFYLVLYGSYNAAFRIPLDDPSMAQALDTIRAAFDTGSGGYWHYSLTRAPDEPTLWFSVPMSTAEGGNHTIYVNMLPFTPFQRTFQVTSEDPCNPTVVDIQLISGDLNGDGCVDDADLLSILFNFGTGC
jgi:hypothetical protein